jgi:hypothetical protein
MGLYTNDDDSPSDDDSFWCEEEGQSHDWDSTGGIPGTTAWHTCSTGMVYKPDPVYLKNDPKHPRNEADPFYCYDKPSLGQ